MYNINDITNKVIFGNSEEELLLIPDESIDAVIIDPPYNILKNHKLDRKFKRVFVFNQLYRVLKKNSLMVIFGIGSQLCRDIVMLEDIGFKCKEEVIWVKQNSSNPMNNLLRRHESFYILSKGNKAINKCYIDYFENCVNEDNIEKLYNSYKRIQAGIKNKNEIKDIEKYINDGIIEYRYIISKDSITVPNGTKRMYRSVSTLDNIIRGNIETTVMFIDREHYNFEHATQKPIELMSRIVKLVSNENDIILDCFAGSGSTLLGAIKNDRNYIGIEIDKEYYDVCIKRLKEHQGLFYKEATK